jgi:hypothetical protein
VSMPNQYNPDKYKDIVISVGEYCVANREFIRYKVLSVDEENNSVLLRKISSDEKESLAITKTLHWARKTLKPLQ